MAGRLFVVVAVWPNPSDERSARLVPGAKPKFLCQPPFLKSATPSLPPTLLFPSVYLSSPHTPRRVVDPLFQTHPHPFSSLTPRDYLQDVCRQEAIRKFLSSLTRRSSDAEEFPSSADMTLRDSGRNETKHPRDFGLRWHQRAFDADDALSARISMMVADGISAMPYRMSEPKGIPAIGC